MLPIVLLSLLLLVVVIAVWSSSTSYFSDENTSVERSAANTSSLASELPDSPKTARKPVDDGSVQRVQADPVEYRIVDRETSKPVVGARVLATWMRRDLGLSDVNGRVSVESPDGKPCDPTRIAIVAEGYLVAIFVFRGPEFRRMNEEYEAGDPIEVRLFRDTRSAAVNICFVLPDGSLASDVNFRLELLEKTVLPLVSTQSDADFEMAWRSHTLACSWQLLGALPASCGLAGNTVIRSCDGAQIIRVSDPGRYRCVATAGKLWLGSTEFMVPTAGRPVDVSVVLNAGHSLSGRVVSDKNHPIEKVAVRLMGGALGAMQEMSGRDGSFEFGPFAIAEVSLRFDHPEFEVEDLPRVALPSSPLVVRLRPTAEVQWEGLVRERGTGRPIAQALVRGGSRETTTDLLGRFSLSVPKTVARIHVEASSYLRYSENLQGGAVPKVFELVPKGRSARVKAGLTTLVFGVLSDELGDPVADAPIQLRVHGLADIAGPKTRWVERGGTLPRASTVTTDPEGRFELETSLEGPSTVFCRSGIVDPERRGRSLTLIRGTRHEVDLQFPR